MHPAQYDDGCGLDKRIHNETVLTVIEMAGKNGVR
jgi:hypothetical protein